MEEVWIFLDQEYGKAEEITVNRIQELHLFKVSKNTQTDSQQFLELYTIWREVFNDLDKIKLTLHLNSPYALRIFLSKDPESCHASYITFKEKPENSGK